MRKPRTELRKKQGKRIKHLRKNIDIPVMDDNGDYYAKKGMTQQEFADRMNVTLETVRNWEQGFCAPDIDTLQKIATFFNCDVDYILVLSDVERRGFSLSDKAIENISHFCDSESGRKFLSDFLEDENFLMLLHSTATGFFGNVTSAFSVSNAPFGSTVFVSPENVKNGNYYACCRYLIEFIEKERLFFNADNPPEPIVVKPKKKKR